MNEPFPSLGDPFAGIPDILKPNPQPAIPEPQAAKDATANASPFSEPLDWDKINENVTAERPLKLFIPDMHKFPDFEFHIINSIASEIAVAHNAGWREVTDPEYVKLFDHLVAGTDKTGKAFRPILCARPKSTGEKIRRKYRLQLRSLYAGMDPSNKELGGKYTSNVDAKDGTKGQFSGPSFRVKV